MSIDIVQEKNQVATKLALSSYTNLMVWFNNYELVQASLTGTTQSKVKAKPISFGQERPLSSIFDMFGSPVAGYSFGMSEGNQSLMSGNLTTYALQNKSVESAGTIATPVSFEIDMMITFTKGSSALKSITSGITNFINLLRIYSLVKGGSFSVDSTTYQYDNAALLRIDYVSDKNGLPYWWKLYFQEVAITSNVGNSVLTPSPNQALLQITLGREL